jgi:phosphatidylglycerophosphatase A
MRSFVVFLAEGLGAGRCPWAPGTVGSIVGVAWFAVLVMTGHLALYVLLAAGLTALSVWACGRAEAVLGQTDPGSIVLDEIVAVPWCYLGWMVGAWSATGQLPALSSLFQESHLAWLLGGFLAFRLFDVWKPWPVDAAQRLPGGWGITADDLLAAAYTNLAGWALAMLTR